MKKLFAALICLLMLLSLAACGEGIGEEGISKEEFDDLSVGNTPMTIYNKVGSSGEKIKESKEDGIYTATYKIMGEKSGYALIVVEADFNKDKYALPGLILKENHDIK